jgi:hypothetical protein
MDRRSLLFMLGGAAFAVALPVVAEPRAVSESVIAIQTRLPPVLGLLRHLHMVPGSFKTATDHAMARELQRYGMLEPNYEDASGVYWKLTPHGERHGAELSRRFPRGVISSTISMLTERA